MDTRGIAWAFVQVHTTIGYHPRSVVCIDSCSLQAWHGHWNCTLGCWNAPILQTVLPSPPSCTHPNLKRYVPAVHLLYPHVCTTPSLCRGIQMSSADVSRHQRFGTAETVEGVGCQCGRLGYIALACHVGQELDNTPVVVQASAPSGLFFLKPQKSDRELPNERTLLSKLLFPFLFHPIVVNKSLRNGG